jgi:heparosan-N-sulfate-glucuronate 5-epimerase
MIARARYLQRVASAYLGSAPSQLTFWHESPETNERAFAEPLGEYYQCFFTKADYDAHADADGVPMLDYHGHVGLQYNPIAIAQWGLGNWNLWRRTGDAARRARWGLAADWLVDRLAPNAHGLPVWKHEFNWEYRDTLRAGWYSALAQGQGLSLLCRAHRATGERRYLDAAHAAFRVLTVPVGEGGVLIREDADGAWLEEAVVSPPTHILNGFLWTIWGVRDYAIGGEAPPASALLAACIRTLERNLLTFDCGFWSLYEQSGTRLPMLASPFYHELHVNQLAITARLLDRPGLAEWSAHWAGYARNPWCRRRAFAQKALFKALYY